jgi:ribosomal-protein-serine acetyltransferase
MDDILLKEFPMAIKTERLCLRPLQAGDGEQLFDAIESSKTNLSKWLEFPKYVKSVKDSEIFARKSYIDFLSRKAMRLAMIYNNSLIGVVGFNYFLWHIPSAEIGYWCVESHQKKGLTSEAVKALKEYAFDQLELKRLAITCLKENVASQKVAHKSGFVKEAEGYGLMKSRVQGELELGCKFVVVKV